MSDIVCYSAGSLNTGQFWGGWWCELRPRNDVAINRGVRYKYLCNKDTLL